MNELLSNLIIENVCSVTTVYNDAGATLKRSTRERWAIIIKYEGETLYQNKGKLIVSNINHMVILPQGCSYEWRCTKSGHYAVIEFESPSKSEDIMSFAVDNSDEILQIFKKLEYKRLRQKSLYKLESIRDTYSIILKLARSVDNVYIPSKKAAMLAPAIDFILENYTDTITNDVLAGLCSISTVYFRKLFKEVQGVSPIEYIKELKIKKAMEMLRGDYGSITDIASSLGYKNIYDFSRDFKKRVGVAPSKYLFEI